MGQHSIVLEILPFAKLIAFCKCFIDIRAEASIAKVVKNFKTFFDESIKQVNGDSCPLRAVC